MEGTKEVSGGSKNTYPHFAKLDKGRFEFQTVSQDFELFLFSADLTVFSATSTTWFVSSFFQDN